MRFHSKIMYLFKSHCEKAGYDLTINDYKFVDQKISKQPKTQLKAILGRYLKEWRYGMDHAESALKAENEGRRMANSWLREYIDEIDKKMGADTRDNSTRGLR